MPIVPSRGLEIRRLLGELADPRQRDRAMRRLTALGARVVPHAEDELARLDPAARTALAKVLRDVQTSGAQTLLQRLTRAEELIPKGGPKTPPPADDSSEGNEATALGALRALPPPRADERPTISRERGEAHLTLARSGSRLARKDLLLSLKTLPAARSRLYCEAAALIGNAEFLEVLARIGEAREEARAALSQIATREKITARSKSVRDLNKALQKTVAQALAGT